MKDLKGWEGIYQISEQGEVISLNYKRTGTSHRLSPVISGKGYLTVKLKDRKHHYIHRLVAETFLENPNHYEEINHKDEDKTNNSVSNLEWCNRQYNNDYSLAKAVTNGVATFKSVKEASRVMGVYHSSIIKSCQTQTKCKGFVWSYV